ncbi:NAD-specific glutamate dehydrogenase large form [Desulfurella amilsii]|uniref:NAD-specific glutamate dehydrogenase large form n=1 Tax=Desulfurella amilsii TaxID=1562698 RepID=A0A1X4XWT0_9BACT|nr:NAD-glutamate dehydrogenase domain-containing protein [Desulfurella amilsii]OSS41991.1 NAD-specific glutamate dehydrogenase large form [Desulfurella amilsii]
MSNTQEWSSSYTQLLDQNGIKKSYLSYFSDDYKLNIEPQEALIDTQAILDVIANQKKQVRFFKQNEEIFFKVYAYCKIPLYEVLPILKNLGLNALYEDFFELNIKDKTVLIQRYNIEKSFEFDIEKNAHFVEENFLAVIDKVVENDELNSLTTKELLDYKQIDLLRTLGNYLMQVDFSVKRISMFGSLVKYSHLSKLFIEAFDQKFNPTIQQRNTKEVFDRVSKELETINNIQDYKILSSIFNIIDSAIRTNFYMQKTYHYISLKIDSSKISKMPLPRPMYEIYVHSFLMEGCHLRGGKVARGGIRWSDRKDDFRLEILELMKTQMVKNAVIVPVGSKGGFIIKHTNGQDIQEKAIESYKTLMRGMLDITDNYSGSKEQLRPNDAVCYDDFDPYLVVAADKGTAKFSDTANDIAQNEYSFWLKDAFASGGKFGYDHKELGITSKGSLVCTKRHFSELGVKLNSTPISVVGVGDMGGDVFGNAMIELKNIQLKAAFNDKEIFVDPNPDIEASYKERKRLFDNALTWSFYNKDTLSKGGFVCKRDERTIVLSSEAKAFLKTSQDTVSSEELIKMIFKTNADLLWMGGVGTYVKASDETNEDAGDKTNDNVRINANEVKAKVVGEGANLGFTQKARIEYALLGGKINTDSLDNSAGVDLSDQEVNLKILLNDLMESKTIKDLDERNNTLKKLTPEVIQRVLDHNYMQSLAVSLDEIRSKKESEVFYELVEFFKQKKLFSESEYYFPNKITLASRIDSGVGYTKPELSIMLSLLKIFIFTNLLKETNFDKYLIDKYALLYFPPSTREIYKEHIQRHLLKKEIGSTYITNLIVNSNGVGSLIKINMLTGQPFTSIIKTLIFIYDLLDVQNIRNEIFTHEGKINQAVIYQTIIDMFYAVERFATNQLYLFGDSIIEYVYKQEILGYMGYYIDNSIKEGVFKSKYEEKTKELSAYFSKELSEKIAQIYFIDDFILAYYITRKTDKNFIQSVQTIEKVNEIFGFQKVINYISSIRIVNEWDRFAQFSMIKKYTMSLVKITIKILNDFSGNTEALIAAKKTLFDSYISQLNDISKLAANNLHPIVLLYDKLESLV